MRTNDLMIGDWVLVDDMPTRVTDIDELEGINREWNGGVVREDAGCINWEHIEPIPLTEEILEKNGFIRTLSSSGKLCGWYLEKDLAAEYYVIDVTYNNDRLYIEIHGSVTIEKYYDYVHELQHALKLCGIEREIVL